MALTGNILVSETKERMMGEIALLENEIGLWVLEEN